MNCALLLEVITTQTQLQHKRYQLQVDKYRIIISLSINIEITNQTINNETVIIIKVYRRWSCSRIYYGPKADYNII